MARNKTDTRTMSLSGVNPAAPIEHDGFTHKRPRKKKNQKFANGTIVRLPYSKIRAKTYNGATVLRQIVFSYDELNESDSEKVNPSYRGIDYYKDPLIYKGKWYTADGKEYRGNIEHCPSYGTITRQGNGYIVVTEHGILGNQFYSENHITEELNPRPFSIISGGQEGVDYAAMVFAVQNGVALSGYMPRYRRTVSKNPRHKMWPLLSIQSYNYPDRTIKNIYESNCVLILKDGDINTPGTLLTVREGISKGVPVYVCFFDTDEVFRVNWYKENIDRRAITNMRDCSQELKAHKNIMIAGPRDEYTRGLRTLNLLKEKGVLCSGDMID